ncbi:hypothetical protein SynPROS91_00931 [Synechococcus sp. PROS-9-1]|nr:hypothetical protein SynPROS91_00931 [Synechococcus sp. PROS-9-1]
MTSTLGGRCALLSCSHRQGQQQRCTKGNGFHHYNATCYPGFRQEGGTAGKITMQLNDQIFKTAVLQRFLSISQV